MLKPFGRCVGVVKIIDQMALEMLKMVTPSFGNEGEIGSRVIEVQPLNG